MYHHCDIKFGGITNLTDARYAAAIYARWIGFCLVPGHPRYIEPSKAKEIIDWLSGPEMVAEIGDMSPEDGHEGLQVLGIPTVQLSGIRYLSDWKNLGYKVILEAEEGDADFLLSTEANTLKPHIIDITAYSLEDIKKLAAEEPFAINITGGDETVPGMRDFAEIDEILEYFALEEE